MTKDLESKLLKAKIELMSRSPFISTIALSLRHIITDKCTTADVCGTTVRYNPTFIEKQSVIQFAGLMAHECWHVAFQHLARRGNRDPLVWNAAADYVINFMLIKAGFEIPKEGLLDSKYDEEWTTDTVYEDLMKDKQDYSCIMLDLNDEGEGEGDSPTKKLSIDSEITNIIVRARTQALASGRNIKGDIPDEILRTIDELLNPKLPWQVILHKFLDNRVKEDYSWARKNRRYRNAYMPSMHSYGLGNLTFAIDTSSSVSETELQEMLSEIKGIQQTFNPESMRIIDCDAEIHEVYEVTQGMDILDLDFHGGGGTSFLPVLDYVDKHPTQALIYFTDLYGEEEIDPVDYPVLWICNSDHPPATIGETIYVDHYCPTV
jgi:predicted metal-dependent peptidase